MSDQLEMFDLAPAQTIYPVDDYRAPDKNDTQTPYCMDCGHWRPAEKVIDQDEMGCEFERLWYGGPGRCDLRKRLETVATGYCSKWSKL